MLFFIHSGGGLNRLNCGIVCLFHVLCCMSPCGADIALDYFSIEPLKVEIKRPKNTIVVGRKWNALGTNLSPSVKPLKNDVSLGVNLEMVKTRAMKRKTEKIKVKYFPGFLVPLRE